MKIKIYGLLLTVLQLLSLQSNLLEAKEKKIRVGFFPNITHAQAIIGMQGMMNKMMGLEVKIETKIFNAGPSAVEALFANAVDLAYVGPIPAINAFIKSKGDFVIISGSAQGGGGLVVRSDLNLQDIENLAGKTIATPQFGSTQDITARYWLKTQGFKIVADEPNQKKKEIRIYPIFNSDQIQLMKREQLDGSWSIEPWITRLELESDAELLVDENKLWEDMPSAVIVVNRKFLKENPDLVEKWLRGHVQMSRWANQNSPVAAKILAKELKKIGAPISYKLILKALKRVNLTWEIPLERLEQQAKMLVSEDLIEIEDVNFSKILNLNLLDKVLYEELKN